MSHEYKGAVKTSEKVNFQISKKQRHLYNKICAIDDVQTFVAMVIDAQKRSLGVVYALMQYMAINGKIDAIDALLMHKDFSEAGYWNYTNSLFATRMVLLYLQGKLSKNSHFQAYLELYGVDRFIHYEYPSLIEYCDNRKILEWLGQQVKFEAMDKYLKKRVEYVVLNILLCGIWHRDESLFQDTLNQIRIEQFDDKTLRAFFDNVLYFIPKDMFVMLMNGFTLGFIQRWFVPKKEQYSLFISSYRKNLVEVMNKFDLYA